MKKFKCLFFSLFFFFIITTSVKANSISRISMDIYVDNSGNAQITEVWKANLSTGSEGYHPYYNLSNSSIIFNYVTDDLGNTYTYKTNWDIKNTLDEKKKTFGIYKTGSEVDLCWGITQYGNRTYTLKYTINNFIYNTSDNYQILYWQLIPYDLSSKPNSTYIKVYADKSFSDSLDVWGYGNYGGTAYVYDGYIEMQSDGALGSDEYMTMLVKFPANTFNTTNKIDKTFDDIYTEADEGTTHYTEERESGWTTVFYIFMSFIPFLVIFIFTYNLSTNKTNKIKNKVIPKDPLPFRDLPFKSDYQMAYLISSEYKLLKKQTDYLGALLLKWIKEDNVQVTTEEQGIFKTKNTKIIMNVAPTDDLELEMYNMMLKASKDNILESNEFSNYCSNHYTEILAWFDKVIDNKLTEIKSSDYISLTQTKTLFGMREDTNATNLLNEKAQEMAGLKVFFKDFTSLNEKEPIEVKMWQDYLIYAQIFGMAKEVAKDFNKLYPNVITDETYNNIILIHDFSYYGVNAASVARSRAESYSAGGGGFSSGGGGGGSFGGGGGGGGFR